jgi:uncharacterized Fe-S cluster-containing radical SAM superfamily protein
MNRTKLGESLDRMRRIAVPEEGVYAIAPLEATGMPNVLSDVLRVFRAIDFKRGRRPSRQYDPDFDMFNHVLSDSPTTIASKMKSNWQTYCHHAIVQIGICNFRCFYCYVDFRFLSGRNVVEVDAEEVINQFLRRRQELKQKGIDLNVLRISGGEPMLAPDLTLSCLRKVRELGLEGEVCIKTETNLSPLVPIDGKCAAERWVDLKEFTQYPNFIIHPTFHGIDQDSLRRIAAVNWDEFEMMLDAIRLLLEHQIDFYPSFGANTVAPDQIDDFFDALRAIHPKLPLRIAVRKFDLEYDSPATRDNGSRDLMVFDHQETIRGWDRRLRDEYGVGYGELARHAVPLN